MRAHDKPGPGGCVSERALIALATGDGESRVSAHVSACRSCERRLAEVETDLIAIVGALCASPTAPQAEARPRRRVWIAATAAAAAVAVVAFGVGVRGRTEPSLVVPAADPPAFLRSVSESMFVAPAYERAVQPREALLNGRRACTWGSLSMPCEALAWAGDTERPGW
jgi:hypothetical protein